MSAEARGLGGAILREKLDLLFVQDAQRIGTKAEAS